MSDDLRERIEALPRYALLPSLDALPFVGPSEDGPLVGRAAVLDALSSPTPAPPLDVERLARAWGNLEDNDGFLHASDIDDLTAEYARLPASPLSPQTAPSEETK